MNIKFAVVALTIGLCGCSSLSSQSYEAAIESSDLVGCFYAGVLYSPGATKLSERAVSDGVNVQVVEDRTGIPMVCVKDRGTPEGYRWDVPSIAAR